MREVPAQEAEIVITVNAFQQDAFIFFSGLHQPVLERCGLDVFNERELPQHIESIIAQCNGFGFIT
jgi:hypothetical protein